MIPFAFGHCTPYAYTWDITSWRTNFSRSFATSKLISSLCTFNSAICSSVISSPNSCSVSANAIHNLLHVLNFISGEKIYCIALLAYLSDNGLVYLSVLIIYSPLFCYFVSLFFLPFKISTDIFLWRF